MVKFVKKTKNKENLYHAVNKLNKIKFKINDELFNYLLGKGNNILNHYFKTLKDKTDINKNNYKFIQ